MMAEVGGIWEGAEAFLKWGPLGLASLMLVLVFLALARKSISSTLASLLRHLMYTAAVLTVILTFAPAFVRSETVAPVVSKAMINRALNSVDSAAKNLADGSGLALARNCSGGGHGEYLVNVNVVAGYLQAASADISATKAALDQIAENVK